jgi:hypothetical protein
MRPIITIVPAPPTVTPIEHILALQDDLETHYAMTDLAYRLGMTDLAAEIATAYHVIADQITLLTGTDPRPAHDEEV